MPLDAFLLAFGAAVVHAVWNVLVAGAEDSRAATAIMLLVGPLALAPVAGSTWNLGWHAAPFIAGSAVLELVYFALLALAYTTSELSLVYPIARGAAPVLVLAASCCVSRHVDVRACGRWRAARRRRRLARHRPPQPERPRGLGLALAIAASIAGYTLVDKYGLRYASPAAYLLVVLLLTGPPYALAVAARRGVAALRSELRGRVVLAGVGTVAAYGLVLAALERAAAAPVAAVRESSVLIATALAALLLRERVGPARLAGATAIMAGVALVSVS